MSSDENEEQERANHDTFENAMWPCLFTKSDTNIEKEHKEFYTNEFQINFDSFLTLRIVKNTSDIN